MAPVGVIFGLSGMTHGLAETLQGDKPTGSLLINAIGAGSSWTRWSEGFEGAFTIVPNFLLTGILAMLVGLAIIIWSLGFVHRRHAPLSWWRQSLPGLSRTLRDREPTGSSVMRKYGFSKP